MAWPRFLQHIPRVGHMVASAQALGELATVLAKLKACDICTSAALAEALRVETGPASLNELLRARGQSTLRQGSLAVMRRLLGL